MWFVGFSPDLAVGVFIGYDKPRSLGNAATGGQYAAPVFRDFMQMALKDKPATPFRVPPGIKLIRDRRQDRHARRLGEGGGTILEAFKPGTAPPDSYSPASEDDGPIAGRAGSRAGRRRGHGRACTERWSVERCSDRCSRRISVRGRPV